ncbi:hypothetical protein B0H34DRAFT_536390 [Crassisporium funariophilum]|nr:hypothetical protein B0H34DRAFT_536390 [Crassisporium funariophilum]
MSSSHSLDRPILAQELVEHIFTFLNPVTDPESRSALRICAYASPSLCIISQKRLFYEVILDHSRNIEDTPPTVSPPHLALILDTSPHITAYIRSLKIICFESPYVADPDDYTHWLCRDYDVSCLHLLVNLQEISLSAKTEPPILQINRSQVMWGSIFPAIQKTLLKVIASSSLTRLDISGVAQFPATFFHTLPDSLASLKHLSLPELKFSGQLSTINQLGCPTADRLLSDWFSSQSTGFKHPQLDSLSFVDLSYMKHTMMWVLDPRCPIDLTRLRSLRLLFKSSDSINKGFEVEVEDISRLLRLCAGSLEDLHMNVNEEPRSMCFANDPVLNPN